MFTSFFHILQPFQPVAAAPETFVDPNAAAPAAVDPATAGWDDAPPQVPVEPVPQAVPAYDAAAAGWDSAAPAPPTDAANSGW